MTGDQFFAIGPGKSRSDWTVAQAVANAHHFIQRMKEIGAMAEEDRKKLRGKNDIGTSAHEAVESMLDGPTDPNERVGELAEIVSAALVELASLSPQANFPALFYIGTDQRIYRLDAYTPGMTRREAHLAGALVVSAKHELGRMLRESDDPWVSPGQNRINDLGPDKATQKAMAKMRGYQPTGKPVLAVINEHDVKFGYLDRDKGEFEYTGEDPNQIAVMPEYDKDRHLLVRVISKHPVKARVWADRSNNEQVPQWHDQVYWGWVDSQGAFYFFDEADSSKECIWTHNYQKMS